MSYSFSASLERRDIKDEPVSMLTRAIPKLRRVCPIEHDAFNLNLRIAIAAEQKLKQVPV